MGCNPSLPLRTYEQNIEIVGDIPLRCCIVYGTGTLQMFSSLDFEPRVDAGSRSVTGLRMRRSLPGRLLAVAAVFGVAALFPNVSRAEFVNATEPAGQSFLFEDDASVMDLVWGGMGTGSDERRTGREESPEPEKENHPQSPRSHALPDAADCCGTGTS